MVIAETEHPKPKSVYYALASATTIALADLVINGDINATENFWLIALGYATVRQAISSFGSK